MTVAVPTPDHYLPMLYIAALADEEPLDLLVDGQIAGSISMAAYASGMSRRPDQGGNLEPGSDFSDFPVTERNYFELLTGDSGLGFSEAISFSCGRGIRRLQAQLETSAGRGSTLLDRYRRSLPSTSMSPPTRIQPFKVDQVSQGYEDVLGIGPVRCTTPTMRPKGQAFPARHDTRHSGLSRARQDQPAGCCRSQRLRLVRLGR